MNTQLNQIIENIIRYKPFQLALFDPDQNLMLSTKMNHKLK